MTPFLADISDPFFPKPTSTTAGSVDDLFYFILIFIGLNEVVRQDNR